MKRLNLFFLYSVMFLVAYTWVLSASAHPPADPTPPDPCTDPNEYCPIDGGVSLLIAAGIGIAAKKAHDARKTHQMK
jgi:hypothetical protein